MCVCARRGVPAYVCATYGVLPCVCARRGVLGAQRRLPSEAGWQRWPPQASVPIISRLSSRISGLSSPISRRRGPRSCGSSNEMEQQKDGEIRLPALPQQIKRWD